MMIELPKIGWIGLGKMGTPMCRRLKAAGYDVTVRVRNERGRRNTEALGLWPVTSMTELAGRSNIIFAAVSDDAALLDLMLGKGGLASALEPRHLFVDTSTVSPAASARVAEALAVRGVGYVRAPVSGSTATAEAGKLTVMMSGAAEDCSAVVPVLEAFSARQFVVGSQDEARYMKLAVNSMVAGMAGLVAEALALGASGGIEISTMLEVMNASAVATPLLGYKTAMLESGDYKAAFSVSQMIKDVDLVLTTGDAALCPMPMATEVRRQFEAARKTGDGEKDFFVLAERALGKVQTG